MFRPLMFAIFGLEAKTCKGKAVPLQARSFPELSMKLRFPVFMTTIQDGGKVVSFMNLPSLPPVNAPGTNFLLEDSPFPHVFEN